MCNQILWNCWYARPEVPGSWIKLRELQKPREVWELRITWCEGICNVTCHDYVTSRTRRSPHVIGELAEGSKLPNYYIWMTVRGYTLLHNSCILTISGPREDQSWPSVSKFSIPGQELSNVSLFSRSIARKRTQIYNLGWRNTIFFNCRYKRVGGVKEKQRNSTGLRRLVKVSDRKC